MQVRPGPWDSPAVIRRTDTASKLIGRPSAPSAPPRPRSRPPAARAAQEVWTSTPASELMPRPGIATRFARRSTSSPAFDWWL